MSSLLEIHVLDGIMNKTISFTYNLYFHPFPTYNTSASDDFKSIEAKILEMKVHES